MHYSDLRENDPKPELIKLVDQVLDIYRRPQDSKNEHHTKVVYEFLQQIPFFQNCFNIFKINSRFWKTLSPIFTMNTIQKRP